MRYSECSIYAHFFSVKTTRQVLLSITPLKVCPRLGDICRFKVSGEEKFYKVTEVCWCFDEEHDKQRVNLLVKEQK